MKLSTLLPEVSESVRSNQHSALGPPLLQGVQHVAVGLSSRICPNRPSSRGSSPGKAPTSGPSRRCPAKSHTAFSSLTGTTPTWLEKQGGSLSGEPAQSHLSESGNLDADTHGGSDCQGSVRLHSPLSQPRNVDCGFLPTAQTSTMSSELPAYPRGTREPAAGVQPRHLPIAARWSLSPLSWNRRNLPAAAGQGAGEGPEPLQEFNERLIPAA